MSFRWFIYYCALVGGWSALFGWLLGRWLAPEASLVAQAGVKGMCLGLSVAAALGLLDAVWVLSLRQSGQAALRTGTAVLVGCLGGLLGGLIGQAVFDWTQWSLFLVMGWTITGLLVGLSIGSFEALASRLRHEQSGIGRKVVNGLLGGTVGGLLGGIGTVVLRGLWKGLFADKPSDRLWSPTAIGFVVLGVCIGLLVGLAQVILKEGWLRVESGFRAGRELLLNRDAVTIGRAEGCDVGLFGDAGVDPRHACIQRQGKRYVLIDAGSNGGTYLNDRRLSAPALLRSGDLIRVGRSVLRFGERVRHAS